MLPYDLTELAEDDLKEIARYTLKNWGKKQSLHYAGLLEKRFREIADGIAHTKPFSNRYSQVRVSRCEYHYIFYIHSEKKRPCIIAVLHERMDILKQLKNRLD